VLFYHGVDNRVNPAVEAEIFDINEFENQIEYLVKHYEIISIEDFEQRFINSSFTNREVVLTFDDGYANNLYIVDPILSKYKLPYTVFISTEHIATGQFFPTSVNRIITKGAGLNKVEIPSQNLSFSLTTEEEINNAVSQISKLLKSLPIKEVRDITNDLIKNVSRVQWLELMEKYKSVRPMNWDEVLELSSKEGVTIGSHCMWHICCHANQSEYDLKNQIEESKIQIEQKINKQCKYFAYPNGDYTSYSNEIVKKNYYMGFSTEKKKISGTKNNISTIPRIGVVCNLNSFKIHTNLYPKK
ncbi:MAG TPA: polysaccharide deacetylase family protein, partial [Gallicola sp.]|nr:polysaccharide deacetylase family protein [Gallicola sp.]